MGYQSNLVETVGTPYVWSKADQTPHINSGTFATAMTLVGTVDSISGGIENNCARPLTSTTSHIFNTTTGQFRTAQFSWIIWIKSNSRPSANTIWAPSLTSVAYEATVATGNYIGTDGIARFGQKVNSQQTPILTGGTIDVCDGNWHMLAFTRNTTSAKLYVDGTLQASTTSWIPTTTVTGNFLKHFQAESSHQIFFDEFSFHSSELSASNIATIYSGYQSAVNISITETPATASNAHFPEPGVSTSTGISFGTEPATATGQISYLSVSGTANFEHSFALATSILTMPTLAFTFNDNTEIVTSITGSAQFVEPFNFGGESNISNTADVMTASADIGTHDSVAGSSISYPANEATATALFQDPEFVGQGDRSVSATALTATALMTTANVSVNASYFHEVKKISPSLYFNGTTTNYGSTPGTISLDSNWTRQPDDAPLNYIFYNGNNHSYDYTGSTGGREQMTISGTSVTSLLNAAHANKQWSLEYWFKSNSSGTTAWSDGDSTPNRWATFGNITIITNNYYFTGNPINPTANGFSITVQVENTATAYQITTGNLTNLAPSLNWNHLVLLQNGNTIGMYVNSVLVLANETAHTPANFETALTFYPSTNESPGFASLDEIAYYDYPITQSVISDHYNYVTNFDPSKIFYAEPFEAAVEITETSVVAIVNRNIPATPITASILFVDPSVIASINLSNSATVLTASANAVEPFFYGDPDVIINEPSMIATADIPPNIYRLDTAYYSYVQTNIAPFRYVTFDVPNSNLDWGSDNDFGAAAPFTYGGSVSLAIDGISNNALLTNGTNYTTSGLIMKESEHDDNWGTLGKNWHTSFWIKKDHTDTNSNGLRVIANLHSYENNKHLIVYQYNNYLYLQVDDKVNTPQTFQSSVNVNVFDQNKHHIVISSKSDDKIQIYKNKILVIDASVNNHVVTTNSTTYLAPNTETNNRARFAVGALITPYAETNLVAIPTPSIMYIDEAHWAVTSINQTGVNNLYAAMPFKVEIEWFADPALSNSSQIVQPTFGTGAGINAAPAEISNAQFVNPSVSADFEVIFNATPLQASATAVEPFSVIADNITNIIFNAQSFIVGAMLMPAQIVITVPGATMYASAKLQYVYPYTDPYRALILSQQYKQLTAQGFIEDVWVWANTYTAGDLD